MAAAIGLGGVFLAALRPIGDFDFWWHLKTGEVIVRTGHLPAHDPFSYVLDGAPWIPYSWLVEVFFYLCSAGIGFHAFPLLKAGAAAALALLTWRSCRLAGARSTVRALVTLSVILLTWPALTVRPHLVSFVCFAATVAVIEQHRRTGTAPLWVLPLLGILWVNSHVFFPLQYGLLGVYVLGRVAPHLGRPGQWAAALRQDRPLLLTLGATALSSLVNPWGLGLWSHVVGLSRVEGIYRLVMEVGSPDFHDPRGLLLAAYTFALWSLLAVSRRRATAEELIVTVGFSVMGLYMWRLVPFFPLATAPIMARHLEALLPAELPAARRTLLAAVQAAVFLALVCGGQERIGWRVPYGTDWRDHIEPDAFPVGAVAYLQTHQLGERLFNSFDWGGFAIYHLFPAYQVSIDSRTHVYGDELFWAYARTHHLAPGWENYLTRARPDVILFRRAEPFVQMVRRLPEWRVAYEDEQAVVFVPAPTRVARASEDDL